MNFKQMFLIFVLSTVMLMGQATPASGSVVNANTGKDRNRIVNRPTCNGGLNGRVYSPSFWTAYSNGTIASEPQYSSDCDGSAWTDYYKGILSWIGFDTVGAPWNGTAGIPSSDFGGTFARNGGSTRFNPGSIAANTIVGRNLLMGWNSSDYTDLHYEVHLNTNFRRPTQIGDVRMVGIYASQALGGIPTGSAYYQNGMFFGNDGHVYFIATNNGSVVHVSRTKTPLTYVGNDLYLRYGGYFNPGAEGLNNSIGEGFRSKWQYSTNKITWANGEDFEMIFGVIGYGTAFNNPVFGHVIGYGAFKWNASGVTPEANYNFWADVLSLNYYNY